MFFKVISILRQFMIEISIQVCVLDAQLFTGTMTKRRVTGRSADKDTEKYHWMKLNGQMGPTCHLERNFIRLKSFKN